DDVELASRRQLLRVVVASRADGAVHVPQAVAELRRQQIRRLRESLGGIGAPALRDEVLDDAIEGERIPVVLACELDEARLVSRGLVVEHEQDLTQPRLDA